MHGELRVQFIIVGALFAFCLGYPVCLHSPFLAAFTTLFIHPKLSLL
jgi:hypothetical protein